MRRTRWLALVSLLVVLSLGIAAPSFAAPAAPPNVEPLTLNVSTTVTAMADTYTNSNSPGTNYGSASQLRVDGSPAMKGYVKFNVSGVSGAVTKATLRLYATSSLADGYKVFQFTNSWAENTLTDKNAPSLGAVIGPSGAVTGGTWASIDVTSIVKGNGTFSFGLRNASSTALNLGSRESANKPQLIVQTATSTLPTPTAPPPVSTIPAPTATRPAPTPTAPPPSGNVKILCDGKTFSNWGSNSPIKIGDNADDTNPNITKVVRNCTFKNPPGVAVQKPAIAIAAGNNILIENSVFDNIRSLQTGVGAFAIGIPGTGTVSNVTITGSYFRDIGADGLQAGYSGTNISNIKVLNSEFVGSEAVGENAIDIKTGGPYTISGNNIHGFRPCQSPKTNPPGTQDCTGSNGPGVVVHVGSVGVAPHDVAFTNNNIWDNIYGINISGGNNVSIRNNNIHDNIKAGVEHSGGSLTLSGNIYSGNPTNCIGISPCQ